MFLPFSETWLNDRTSNDSLSIVGYHSIIRKDRIGARGGGVAYVDDSLTVKRRNDLEFNDIEMLWVEIKLPKLNLLCGVCYRPPGNCIDNTAHFLDCLQNSIDKIKQRPQDLIVLMGDFNAHYDPNNPSSSSVFGLRFCQWFECNSLN